MSVDDELPPHARALLDAARDCDDPRPRDRTRIDGAFAPKLAALGIVPALLAPAPLAAAPAVASAATAGSGLGMGAKLALVLVGASVVTGGVVHVVRERARAPMHAPAHATSVAHEKSRPAPTQPASPLAMPPPVVDATTDAPALQPAITLPATSQSTRPAPRTAVRRTPRLAAPVEAQPAAVQAPAPLAANATAIDDSLREELAIIERANSALRLEHASEALRALDEHAVRFEHGVLSEERRGLRVLALCALDANGAALEARAAFLRASPNALLAPKVRAACAADREDSR